LVFKRDEVAINAEVPFLLNASFQHQKAGSRELKIIFKNFELKRS